MRKLKLSMMISVDGFIASRDPEEYWHNWNEEMDAYMLGFFETVDTFIYGRKSYEEMIAYWPPLTDNFAKIMNETKKLVFSRTLERVTWNARLIKENGVEEIKNLKSEQGKDMVLFAGADLAQTFIKHNLIDEFRLIVNPIVLGGGKPLFKNLTDKLKLNLKDTIPFACGNVLLIYTPDDN